MDDGSERTGKISPITAVEYSRVDAFVDAAFAFAVTLLIIAGGAPPSNLEELLTALGRTPAFLAGFALVTMFWLGHREFGRLVEERDSVSVALSLAIVFMVLIYVFPLRLLSEAGASYLSGGRLPGKELIRSYDDLKIVYGIYGTGFAILAALYMYLYHHALKRGAEVGVTGTDGRWLRLWRAQWLIITLSGILSTVLAFTVPLNKAPWAPGFSYFVIPLAIFFHRLIESRRAGALLPSRQAEDAASSQPAP